MLTSVSLYSPIGTFFDPPDMFLAAPKLVNVNLLFHIFPVVLPWEQARRFRTQSLTVTECLKFLGRSLNLQECHFEHIYSQFISKIIMPHAQLKHFHVWLNNPETFMSLFDGITLPSLSKLCIQYNGSKRLPLSFITSLVLRSACNLERFTIGIQFNYADLIPCLEAVPSLTFLHLEMLRGPDMGLTRHFVALLNPLSNSSQLLLPNLKYFFEFKGLVLCDCRTIVDMLAHRWHSSDDGRISQGFRVSKLQLAEVLSTVPYHVTADVQEELRNLLEEGMLVRIESLVRN